MGKLDGEGGFEGADLTYQPKNAYLRISLRQQETSVNKILL